jgi:hypothetical protein
LPPGRPTLGPGSPGDPLPSRTGGDEASWRVRTAQNHRSQDFQLTAAILAPRFRCSHLSPTTFAGGSRLGGVRLCAAVP